MGLLPLRIRFQNPCSIQLLSSSYHCTPNSRHFSQILSKSLPFTLRTQKSVVRALATESASPPPAKMVKAIRVHELGGPEVLKWEDVEVGEPKEGEVRVKNKAIGLNFIDVYFRKGVYKAATVPYTPGVEACGVVTAVGPGLTGREVGDLVAYAGQPVGSYAEEQILPATRVVPVPPSIDPTVAASLLLKGMTAQFLLRSCFKRRQLKPRRMDVTMS